MNLATARAEGRLFEMEGVKRCRRCGVVKPVSEFHKGSRSRVRPYCKPCDSAMAMAWHRANPERRAAHKLKWYEKSGKRFNLWVLDGAIDGHYRAYLRALYKDPCAYCGGPGGEADHIFPVASPKKSRSIAASVEWQELTGSCHACNDAKGRQSLLEFIAWPEGWLR